MNVQFRDRPEPASTAVAKTSHIKAAIADCDIHPARATKTELYPYLAKRWHEHLEAYDKRPYHGMMEGPPYPKAQPNASRRDAYPPEGGPQGSSLSFMQKQHLDPNNVVLGVLNPLATGQGIRNHDLAAAICSAINDSGWPSFYIEEMVGHAQCQQTVLASLVLEGVFERHPTLKMIMIEAGFGWAPSLSWRLDKTFERLRSEVPHLKRRPSEYIRDHIWWTTQPMEDPEQRDHLFQLIDWIGWDRLLFATDYPHWDYDDPSRALPAGVSDANRDAFYLGNARKLYGIV